MSTLSSLIAPFIMAFVSIYAIYALCRRVDVFSALTDGAKNGLNVVVGMLPALIALLSAVYMLRASGVTDALAGLLSPVMEKPRPPRSCSCARSAGAVPCRPARS